MQYFKHLSSMRNDPKIKRVIAKYGLEGYGLYNLMLESIAGSVETSNPMPFLEETCEDIAMFYNGNSAKIEEMVKFMISQGLFSVETVERRIACFKIYKYFEQSQTRSDKIRELIAAYKLQSDLPQMSQTNLIEENRTEEKIIEKKEKIAKDEKPFKLYGSEGVVKIIDDYYANLQRDFPQVAIDAAIEELTSYIVTTPKYKKDRHDKVLRGWPMDNVRKRHPELFNKSPSTPTKELDADILAVVQRANGGNK